MECGLCQEGNSFLLIDSSANDLTVKLFRFIVNICTVNIAQPHW